MTGPFSFFQTQEEYNLLLKLLHRLPHASLCCNKFFQLESLHSMNQNIIRKLEDGITLNLHLDALWPQNLHLSRSIHHSFLVPRCFFCSTVSILAFAGNVSLMMNLFLVSYPQSAGTLVKHLVVSVLFFPQRGQKVDFHLQVLLLI